MNVLGMFILAASMVSLVTPVTSNAALKTCQSASSDSDGDGFGWEDSASCRVESSTGGAQSTSAAGSSGDARPICSSADLDPDGNGYGWENNATCLVVLSETETKVDVGEFPVCLDEASDPDGDGYGWENKATCVVNDIDKSLQNDYRFISNAYPYRVNGPYAGVLKKCALIEPEVFVVGGLIFPFGDDTCKLNELPFIGHVTPNPTVGNVMERVIVTHDWMGRRFERILNKAPDSLLKMFQSVAVIAIGSDIKRANYALWNGVVSIDPNWLWLSAEEKRTVDSARSLLAANEKGVGHNHNHNPDVSLNAESWAELKYGYYRSFRRADGRLLPAVKAFTDQREFDDIFENAMYLLFHEVAHAVDSNPPATLRDMDYGGSFQSAWLNNRPKSLSPQLAKNYPLKSSVLTDLYPVLEPGLVPTLVQETYTPVFLGEQFAADGAPTFYAYKTPQEDFAELVAVALLKYHYDISLEIYWYDDLPICRVGWGVSNRIANPVVLRRAQQAVKLAVDTGSAMDEFFAGGAGTEVTSKVGESCFSVLF